MKLEEIKKYQSKSWDMNISLEELLNSSPKCKVDRGYKAHKYDQCYNGYCIYLQHPEADNHRTMVGINEDGFMYLGDSTGMDDLPFEDTDGVIFEMFLFGEHIKAMDKWLERLKK